MTDEEYREKMIEAFGQFGKCVWSTLNASSVTHSKATGSEWLVINEWRLLGTLVMELVEADD